MRAEDRARDGEAEPGAAGLAAARAFEPHERLEHALKLLRRNARTFVVDDDPASPCRPPRWRGRDAVEGGVVDQIADRAAKREGRQVSVTAGKSLNDASRPLSAMSSTMLSTSAERSVARLSSLSASPRAKASTASAIACISASVSRIFAFASSSSMYSARSLRLVIEVPEVVCDRGGHGDRDR